MCFINFLCRISYQTCEVIWERVEYLFLCLFSFLLHFHIIGDEIKFWVTHVKVMGRAVSTFLLTHSNHNSAVWQNTAYTHITSLLKGQRRNDISKGLNTTQNKLSYITSYTFRIPLVHAMTVHLQLFIFYIYKFLLKIIVSA